MLPSGENDLTPVSYAFFSRTGAFRRLSLVAKIRSGRQSVVGVSKEALQMDLVETRRQYINELEEYNSHMCHRSDTHASWRKKQQGPEGELHGETAMVHLTAVTRGGSEARIDLHTPIVFVSR